MKDFNSVHGLTEGVSNNTDQLILLNSLAYSGPQTLVQMYEKFPKDPDLTIKLIKMENVGLLCKTRSNEFEPTEYGLTILADINDQVEKGKRASEAVGEAIGNTSTQSSDPFEGMEERSIYLKKDGQIVGLHAIGYPESQWIEESVDGVRTDKTGFMEMERWGNEYDENHKMLGRGSFRVFCSLEQAAKDMEEDGWVRYEGPKRPDPVNDKDEELRKAGSSK